MENFYIMSPITHFGQFGTNDFIEYWTAFQLFFSQQNPYDPELMLHLQSQLGWTAQTPLMMWNPPWLLLLLWPILTLDFGTAASVWIGVNVACVGLVIAFSLDLLKTHHHSTKHYLISIPLSLTFFPLYDALKVGQLGALLAVACIGAIWGIIRRKYTVAACFLLLWTIKVHLFIPLAALLLFRSIRHRYLWRPMLLATALLCVLLLVTELAHPHALTQWIQGVHGRQIGGRVEGVDQWIGTSLTGGVRLLLSRGNFSPVWPMVVVPGLGISIVALLAIRTQARDVFPHIAILAILISACFAPFGWVFDLTVLLPVYLMCVNEAINATSSHRARLTATLAILVQLGCWAQYLYTPYLNHHQFIWVPVVTGLVCGFWGWGRIPREDTAY
jgi:hypothetical protein